MSIENWKNLTDAKKNGIICLQRVETQIGGQPSGVHKYTCECVMLEERGIGALLILFGEEVMFMFWLSVAALLMQTIQLGLQAVDFILNHGKQK